MKPLEPGDVATVLLGGEPCLDVTVPEPGRIRFETDELDLEVPVAVARGVAQLVLDATAGGEK